MANTSEGADGAGRSTLGSRARAPASIELAPGAIVAGKYRVVRALGSGGMSAVFEAENTVTLKRHAVKWLHPGYGTREAGSKRLHREALATSRVRHRNVVDLYDVVLEGDNVVLIMELLVGQSLSTYLRTSTLSFAALVRLLVPAMEGVAAAHVVGVVHRDIKPANIFLVRGTEADSWVPKVIDFGISHASGAELERLTQSGVAVGTPCYISFEQLRGDRDVDGRTDVYGFGVMLYEALVGRPPYDGKSLGEQALRFVTTDPATPRQLRPEVPEGLSAVVEAAIARDREQRTGSLRELIDALRAYADEAMYDAPLHVWRGPPLLPEGAAAAEDPTRPETPMPATTHDVERPKRPRLYAAFAAGAGAVVLGATLLWWTFPLQELRASTREPELSLHDVAGVEPAPLSGLRAFAPEPALAVMAHEPDAGSSPLLPAWVTAAPVASPSLASGRGRARTTRSRRTTLLVHETTPLAAPAAPVVEPPVLSAEPREDALHRAGSVSVHQF